MRKHPAWRLFEKLSAPDPSTGCRNWTGTVEGGGYGLIWVNGKNVGAHRLSYEVAYGPIPEGLNVCHRCDNRRCCEPDHLFAGTQAENMADMIRKGRKPWLAGELNTRSKLTDAIAAEIRSLKGVIPQKDIAVRFGVCASTVSYVMNDKRWVAIPTDSPQQTSPS